MRKQIVHNDPIGEYREVEDPIFFNYIDIIRGSRDDAEEEQSRT